MASLLRGRLTLSIVKPDILKGKDGPVKLEKIKKKITENEFEIIKSQRMRLDKNRAEKFYQEHRGKFFYQRLVSFMSSGEIEVMILQSKSEERNAIPHWRSLMGPTHITKAKSSAPDSIRAQFGYSDTRNSVHGSDSPENAKKEIHFFFPNFNVVSEPKEVKSEEENGSDQNPSITN